MAGLTFLVIYGSLLFTLKTPDINTFCEMLPVIMVFSLYVWDRFWAWPRGRHLLWVLLFSSLAFQVGYVVEKAPQKESFYLKYQDQITQAIQRKDYHLLAERRPGALY